MRIVPLPQNPSTEPTEELANFLRSFSNGDLATALTGLLTPREIAQLVNRVRIFQRLRTDMCQGPVLPSEEARKLGVSTELAERVLRAMQKEYPPILPSPESLTVAIPKETNLRRMVDPLLTKAGFTLSMTDSQNGLGMLVDEDGQIGRPIDIIISRSGADMLTLMKMGVVSFGLSGNDKLIEAQAEQACQQYAFQPLAICEEFRRYGFRMCVATSIKDASLRSLEGRAVATSYPWTLEYRCRKEGVRPDRIVELEGGVERSMILCGTEAIMDIVQSGKSLGINPNVPEEQRVNLGIQSVIPVYAGCVQLFAPAGLKLSNPNRRRMFRFRQRLKAACGE